MCCVSKPAHTATHCCACFDQLSTHMAWLSKLLSRSRLGVVLLDSLPSNSAHAAWPARRKGALLRTRAEAVMRKLQWTTKQSHK